MSVIKIVKENILAIPVETILHFTSFFDKPKKDNSNTWDSVNCYVWQDSVGKLHIIEEHKVYPALIGCYVNVISLNWTREFLFEGDEYWKVFTDEKECGYHKLELDGKKHIAAKTFTPYKDRVYSNTNFYHSNHQRFKTEQEAVEYCSKFTKK